jgi:UDP-N-acetylmuramoyl-tripeptide--D-alanyl-D-alanine ligase
MIRKFLFLYRPKYVSVLVYMLQNSDYDSANYLRWYWRTSDFARVMYRRQLDKTQAARLLVRGFGALAATEVLIGLALIIWGMHTISGVLVYAGLVCIAIYPFVLAHLGVVPIYLGGKYVVEPRRRRAITEAEKLFAEHPGQKIAVVGSYGKTSMKELLLAMLGAGMKVAASPGNKNVAISHAAFARRLEGDEAVVIVEFGEGAPGDVAQLAQLTHPTHAIITGLAPAHLDQYKTLQAAGEDIFSVATFIVPANVYVNGDSKSTHGFMQPQFAQYSHAGALGWNVKNISVGFDGTKFVLTNGDLKMRLHCGLLGEHHVGPVALVAVLAYELGMSVDQIEAAVATVHPHEHRMSPYQLAGAWVIDDTYNGNIEGIRAGTQLLKELPGKRKLYVTPGLVDQGEETAAVHQEMGKLIAVAAPDVVILMKNSVTEYITAGLQESGFAGELRIETDPLAFYTNLAHIVAVGDVVMMQNDWPDNYA